LPPGYRIECGTDDNPHAIRVTTPSGTNTLSMSTRPARTSLDSEEIGQSSASLAPPGRSDYYDHSRAGWQQPQHPPQSGIAGSYSPNSRVMGGGLYGQQGGQAQAQEHHYEYQNQQEQQTSAANAAAALHQQEQRGVSQLQSAAAVTAAAGRASLLQPSTGTASGPGPMNSLAGIGSGVLQGAQADLNKRGPVEFNHAISYVNKIKVSYFIPNSDKSMYSPVKTFVESVCKCPRDLQAVPGNLTNLPTGVETHPGRLRPSDPSFPHCP
jgi:paired amphipathic helix protein Sin3a